MKILKVIHGYPPRYSAGSEVYSQILSQELSNNHELQVFTRQENNFIADYTYTTELDSNDPRILLHLINLPRAKYPDKYINTEIDKIFGDILKSFKPDIVHFGHLNHLSLNLPKISFEHNIANIFTLHDFWLMCPRGQFIQRNSKELSKLCDGQEDKKCALQCYKGKFSGIDTELEADLAYWERWVHSRMENTRNIGNFIDMFIAPSKFLLDKFAKDFGLHKIIYMDYGFDLKRLKLRTRKKEPQFVFGYIGTHAIHKGIDLLIKAFVKLEGDALLRIWGFTREETASLKALATTLPKSHQIEWMGGYDNTNIVDEVFNKFDALVVPSIWGENSPLVIHEAQQLKVPVLTANYGGMSEYVQHNVNGLLFTHRDIDDLTVKMQTLLDDPTLVEKLGKRGYLYTEDGKIPDIIHHVLQIEEIYKKALSTRNTAIPISTTSHFRLSNRSESFDESSVVNMSTGERDARQSGNQNGEEYNTISNFRLSNRSESVEERSVVNMSTGDPDTRQSGNQNGEEYNTISNFRLSNRSESVEERSVDKTYMSTGERDARQSGNQNGKWYKPGPWRITFDTNPDHCNYKCIMCECFSPYSKTKDVRKLAGLSKKLMPINIIRKVLEESKDTPLREIIPSTMGEPLLYKDFDEIIEMCKEFNLKLNLTTNGSFPIKGVKKWAEALLPVLSDIKISWNGATKETHEKIMQGSSWEQVCFNLKKFIEYRDEYSSITGNYRSSITLQVTFLESNFNELSNILDMAISLGIDRLKGHHLWDHFDEIKDLSMRKDVSSIKRWNDKVEQLKKIAVSKSLLNGKRIILENFDILSESATKDIAPGGPCPFLGKEAWINTEGIFNPCCAPDELRKVLGNFGSVEDKTLQEIWQGNQYQNLRKNYQDYDLCKGCNMRKQLVAV